jgi:hypothetical protein
LCREFVLHSLALSLSYVVSHLACLCVSCFVSFCTTCVPVTVPLLRFPPRTSPKNLTDPPDKIPVRLTLFGILTLT